MLTKNQGQEARDQMQLVEENTASKRMSLFEEEARCRQQYVGGQGGGLSGINLNPTYQSAGDSHYQNPEGVSRGIQFALRSGQCHTSGGLSSSEGSRRKPRRKGGDRSTMVSGSTGVHRRVDRLGNQVKEFRTKTIRKLIFQKQRNPKSQTLSKKSNPYGKDVKYVNTVAHDVLRLLRKQTVISADLRGQLISQKMTDTSKFNWIIRQSEENKFGSDFKRQFLSLANEVILGKKEQAMQLKQQENDGSLNSDGQILLKRCQAKIKFLEDALISLETHEISPEDAFLGRFSRNKKTGRKSLGRIR